MPKPIDVRQAQPTTEAELRQGYGPGIGVQLDLDAAGLLLSPASEALASLEAIAREVATIRELTELLVDWAGARDRPPADDGVEP